MKIIKTEAFIFEGQNYEIRIYASAWDFTVRAFQDSRPANGYSYSVRLPTAIDLEKVYSMDALQILVEQAKRDIHEKIWEKYVEAHVTNLKKSFKDSLGCRKCGSRRILVSYVDKRDMYECEDCCNIWYSTRKSSNGPLSITDEIIEKVEENGSYETVTSILLNFVFRPDNLEGHSFEDQLANWANQNKLIYKPVMRKGEQRIRFWR